MVYYRLFTDEDLDIINKSPYPDDLRTYLRVKETGDNSLQSLSVRMKYKYAFFLKLLLTEPMNIRTMKYVNACKEHWIETIINLTKCNYTPDSIRKIVDRVLKMLEDNKILSYELNDDSYTGLVKIDKK